MRSLVRNGPTQHDIYYVAGLYKDYAYVFLRFVFLVDLFIWTIFVAWMMP